MTEKARQSKLHFCMWHVDAIVAVLMAFVGMEMHSKDVLSPLFTVVFILFVSGAWTWIAHRDYEKCQAKREQRERLEALSETKEVAEEGDTK